jgi:2-succinyl-5-enolpyruvyl-6-hydroxy-3-cyclohexene-1-carboxylate synthase
VCSQRGLNGIDGLISGAVGAASVAERETTLLVGDVSFLHDVGGLYAARELKRPLTIVVLNNDGGRIFEQLPVLRGAAGPVPDAHAWLTPHGLSLEHASQLYGLAHTRVSTLDALQTALHAKTLAGARVIEACVAGRSTSALLTAVSERLESALMATDPAHLQ